ncbi:MAG TPA: SAM-dependent methyltransferase [Haliscomenobacter sp.]|uniref:SAM-dependent methyltransferase n=1 Tax=Haliscomenobacter sp. TaxID=2717303 RepID=UPI002C2EC839|nr:SAM-dependent methyltransferase [Haliscomenobacter sp.]HOY17277.1 SAM-dependent methyltransferase [Haliscomenobacter sp.]HPH17577.1 SAM-dependent methyltransferase [Haliscomenobacter sp.]
MQQQYGKLFLIPVPLGENAAQTIPNYVTEIIRQLDYFIVERAKTARFFIKAAQHPRPLPELEMVELSEHTKETEYRQFLAPATRGRNIGLMSEAGCPGVADPGAVVVELAHRQGIQVVPLVGPSSILLALMGSGMNGQKFSFQGYLSAKKENLGQQLKRLEQLAQKENCTQIFIEAPYRNQQIVEAALKNLAPQTRLCIAVDLTLPTEFIQTRKIEEWKRNPPLDLHKRPAIFLLG